KNRKRDKLSPSARRDKDRDQLVDRQKADKHKDSEKAHGNKDASKDGRPSVFDRLGSRSADNGGPTSAKRPKQELDRDAASEDKEATSDKPKDKENDRDDKKQQRRSLSIDASTDNVVDQGSSEKPQQRVRKFTALNTSQRVQPAAKRQQQQQSSIGRRDKRNSGNRGSAAAAASVGLNKRRSRSQSDRASKHSSARSRSSSSSASASSASGSASAKSRSKSPVASQQAFKQKQPQQQSNQAVDQVELARELYRRKLANLPQPSAIKERRAKRKAQLAEAAAAASANGPLPPPGTNIVLGLEDDLPSQSRGHRYKYANMPFAPPGRRRLNDDESPAAVGAAAAAAAKAAAAAEAARLAEPCILTEVLQDLDDVEDVSDTELTLPEEECRLASLLGPPPAPHRGIVESLGVDWNVLRSAGAAAAGHQQQHQLEHQHHQHQYYYQRPADLLPGPVLCRLGVSKRLAGDQLYRLVSCRLPHPGLLSDRPAAHRSQLARLRAREAPLLGCAGPHGGGALSARVDLSVRRFLLASLSGTA
ncbi:hypothetical protein BOX15_Mlig009547g1, partial [Macrostomum lignano]